MSGVVQKTQILYYFESGHWTNSTRALVALMKQLDRNCYQVRALLPTGEGNVADHLRAHQIAFDVISMPAQKNSILKWMAYYRKIFRYFQMYYFHLVHADGTVSSLLSIGFKIRFDVPLIWHLGTLLPNRVFLAAYRFLASVFSDQIVASALLVSHQLGRSPRWRNRVFVLRCEDDVKEDSQAIQSLYQKIVCLEDDSIPSQDQDQKAA